jgi:Tol biopolymer transport system component
LESQTLRITDREGREERVLPLRKAWAPRFSPDGRRVAYAASAPGRDSSDLWVTDVRSGSPLRLTTDGNNWAPIWSPDGKSIAYQNEGIFVRALAGGPARLVARRRGWLTDWVPDGSALLFNLEVQANRPDIWMQPLDGAAARPFATTPAREFGARVSPDGRWVVYQSDESGSYEVYVQSYPNPGLKTRVSAGGGVNPVWRRDGRELYYLKGRQLFSVSFAASGEGDAPVVRGLTPLLGGRYAGNYWRNYDASPDGKRFAILTASNSTSRLVVVLHALNAGSAERDVR